MQNTEKNTNVLSRCPEQ